MEQQYRDCPKCTTGGKPSRMVAEYSVGAGNSIDRDVTTSMYHAWHCISCGKHIDIPFIAETRKVEGYRQKQPTGITYRTNDIRAVVIERLPEIQALRADNKGFYGIVKRLKLTFSHVALQRHYTALTTGDNRTKYWSDAPVAQADRLRTALKKNWQRVCELLADGMSYENISKTLKLGASRKAIGNNLRKIKAEMGGENAAM